MVNTRPVSVVEEGRPSEVSRMVPGDTGVSSVSMVLPADPVGR